MLGNFTLVLKIFFKKCASFFFFLATFALFIKNLVVLPIKILMFVAQEFYYGILFLKESFYKAILTFSNVKRVIFFLKKYQNTKKYSFYIFFYTNYLNNFNLPLFILEFFLTKKYKNITKYAQSFRMYYRFNHKTNVLVLTEKLQTHAETFLIGWLHLWLKLRMWILPLICAVTFVYWSLVTRLLVFNKAVIGWVIIFMLAYWLLSGFVFFFKKYQFGKYTSAIQRFWKRSYILFWLLETCLLSVFIYLTFVASQESFYAFDQIQIYKTHLFSWRIFFLKIIPVAFLLILSYILMLNLKWNLFSKTSLFILIITAFLTYTMWLEFYQFYHIINFYGNLNWLFDIEERIWNLELEPRRTRLVNNYVMWLLILKFWHLLFVYIFWVFFILRSNEIKTIKYPLLAANYQNILILYIMSWLYMYPWIKLFFRKFMDIPYNWFYINNRTILWRIFFNDLKIYWYGLTSLNVFTAAAKRYEYSPYFYWIKQIKNQVIAMYQKHYIKFNINETLLTEIM